MTGLNISFSGERKSPNHIEDYYENLSSSYDELYGQEQSKKHDKVRNKIESETFDLTLDVGCGTGTLLEKIRNTSRIAVGIDLSAQMLRRAKARPESQWVDLVRASSNALPMKDSSANCVLSISLVDHKNENWRLQLSELKRTVEPKGTLVVSLFHSENQPPEPAELGLPADAKTEPVSRRETLYYAKFDRKHEHVPRSATLRMAGQTFS